MFGSISDGTVEVSNFCYADDCLSTLKVMEKLGVDIKSDKPSLIESKNLKISGVGKYGFKDPEKALDVGNSGTTLRILPGMLVAQSFDSELRGDDSVSKRPMMRVIDPLQKMGAKIESTSGHAPIKIFGNKELKAIEYQTTVPSAQVKSALLLAGLYTEGRMVIKEEYQSRDHTERMLSYLGADLQVEGTTYNVDGNPKLRARPIVIPGDISSAAFFIVAALLLPNSNLTIKNVGINPTRDGGLRVLEKAGASIRKERERTVNNEPVADLTIKTSFLKPFEISRKEIPLLIDEIPILSVAATQINGTSIVSGAEELRVKETDRLKAISTQLNLMGANIEEKADGLIIHGPAPLKGAVVDSQGDHRMAMSLAIADLLSEEDIDIKGKESIRISFPGFNELLDSVVRN